MPYSGKIWRLGNTLWNRQFKFPIIINDPHELSTMYSTHGSAKGPLTPHSTHVAIPLSFGRRSSERSMLMENHWETWTYGLIFMKNWTWLTTVDERLCSLYSCHAHFIVLKYWGICITIKDFSLRKCTVAKKSNWWNFDLTTRCLFWCECHHRNH